MAADRTEAAPGGSGGGVARLARFVRRQLETAVLTPVRAFRWRYLPLLMIYFAYGALGLTAIATSFWVKETLTLKPADLAALAVWLSLPWAMKMVFGQLVDSVPILGSQRRVYVFIGAGLLTQKNPTSLGASWWGRDA
jgi:hypothetical protein